MGKIYIGPNSYYGIEVSGRAKKAVANVLAQLIDFLDGDTVIKIGNRFKRVKFEFSGGEGDKVSFVGRMRVIYNYAPKSVRPILERFYAIASKYAKGEISERQAITLAKQLARKVLTEAEINQVIRKVRQKD